jgi:hypothetical protein
MAKINERLRRIVINFKFIIRFVDLIKPQKNGMKNSLYIIILAAIFLLACFNLNAQQKVIQLYDKGPQGSESWNWQEKETTENPFNTRLIYNVTQPTLTAFMPDSSISNGTAIIVCPGGAFQTLFIDLKELI